MREEIGKIRFEKFAYCRLFQWTAITLKKVIEKGGYGCLRER